MHLTRKANFVVNMYMYHAEELRGDLRKSKKKVEHVDEVSGDLGALLEGLFRGLERKLTDMIDIFESNTQARIDKLEEKIDRLRVDKGAGNEIGGGDEKGVGDEKVAGEERGAEGESGAQFVTEEGDGPRDTFMDTLNNMYTEFGDDDCSGDAEYVDLEEPRLEVQHEPMSVDDADVVVDDVLRSLAADADEALDDIRQDDTEHTVAEKADEALDDVGEDDTEPTVAEKAVNAPLRKTIRKRYGPRVRLPRKRAEVLNQTTEKVPSPFVPPHK